MSDGAPPRVSTTRAALIVVVGLTAGGALVGALWAWLAPPARGVVALTRSGQRIKAYLGNESDHFFVSAFLAVGMLGVLAVIAAVLLWQWRSHRGPVTMAALALGSSAAGGAAAGVGAVLSHWRYGSIDIASAPVTPEHRLYYVTEAPAVFFGHWWSQIAITLLLPAGAAALVYGLAAVATARDDLGAWPPVETPAGVTGRSGTAVDAGPVDPSSPSR